MKKIIIALLIFFVCNCAIAKQTDSVKFEGHKYKLSYSAKNPETSGYINEYYKAGESPNSWTEMVGVHYFPNNYSPIAGINELRDFMESAGIPYSIYIDEENNTGMIDFIMTSDSQLPIILEFNVMKYEKHEICGTVAVQYAKRYCVYNKLQIKDVKKSFEKSRKKVIKDLQKFNIPQVVKEEIGK